MSVLWAMIATLGFSMLFQLRGLPLVGATVNGALGWAVYLMVLALDGSGFAANLGAAFLVTMVAELLTRLRFGTVMAFLIPGLIPLVPGSQIYRAMEMAVRGLPEKGLALGLEAMAIAAAIVAGVVTASSLARISFARPPAQPRSARR